MKAKCMVKNRRNLSYGKVYNIIPEDNTEFVQVKDKTGIYRAYPKEWFEVVSESEIETPNAKARAYLGQIAELEEERQKKLSELEDMNRGKTAQELADLKQIRKRNELITSTDIELVRIKKQLQEIYRTIGKLSPNERDLLRLVYFEKEHCTDAELHDKALENLQKVLEV